MAFSENCPACKQPFQVNRARLGVRAHRFEDLAFRCGACGIGFSNSTEPGSRRRIYDDPRDNVPLEVRDGLVEVLKGAANIRNRPSKRFKFGSSRSEDAVTWTVFEGLRQSDCLDRVLPPASRSAETTGPPVVLAWGHPVAGTDGAGIAAALQAISKDLGEKAASRSEPDVVLVWPDLVVLVEVKLDSANDRQPEHRAFPAYVDGDRHLYAVPAAVAAGGFYELTRNWTIAARLAAKLDRSMLLINLGPTATAADAGKFSALLVQDDRRRFAHRTWSAVLNDAHPLLPWLSDYIQRLGIPSTGHVPRHRVVDG